MIAVSQGNSKRGLEKHCEGILAHSELPDKIMVKLETPAVNPEDHLDGFEWSVNELVIALTLAPALKD